MPGKVVAGEYDPRTQALDGLFAAAEHEGAGFGMVGVEF